MKFTTITVLAIISVLFLPSCKKKYDAVSTLKTVPSVRIAGERFMTISVGGAYSDIGATFINEEGVSTTIGTDSGNTVDVNTPGLYVLNYSRATPSRFTAGDVRYVAVTDIPDSADLSGDYLRAATGTTTTVSKVSRGLYLAENFGGSSTSIDVYFAQISDSTLSIPEQPTSGGVTSGEDATVTYPYTDSTVLQYRVINASFGTAIRTFQKQP